MRTTLFFKRADVVLQVLAVIIPVLFAAFSGETGILYCLYFSVGAIQLVSAIINKLSLDAFYKSHARKYYEMCLACLVFITVLACVMKIYFTGQLLMLSLVYFTPIMAVWYFCCSITETRQIRRMVDRKQYV